jgi:hypothetical protein
MTGNISATILKSMGDNGSPLLRPFFRLEVLANVFIDFNGHTTTRYKIMDQSIPLNLTLSYAFLKSIFNITPFNFFGAIRGPFHVRLPPHLECLFLA